MSGRVVDKLQIDRHYRMDELAQLYTLKKFDFSKRKAPSIPKDDILKSLLLHHPRQAFKYHDHDSLLENKPEQGLSEEEIKEAWAIYEAESKGPIGRAALMNGNMNPSPNDILRSDLMNYNLFNAPNSSIDAATGLFKALYPSSGFYPSDYLTSLMLSDAFRSSLAPATSSPTGGLNSTGSSSKSALLRSPLSPVYSPMSMFGMMPQPSTSASKSPLASASVQKQRTSNSVKRTAASMENLSSSLAVSRYNGSQQLSRPDVHSSAKNSSANMSLLPDLDVPIVRSPITATKGRSGSLEKSTAARTRKIYDSPTTFTKRPQPTIVNQNVTREAPIMKTLVFPSQTMAAPTTTTKSPVPQSQKPSISKPASPMQALSYPSLQRSQSSTSFKSQPSTIIRQLPLTSKTLPQAPMSQSRTQTTKTIYQSPSLNVTPLRAPTNLSKPSTSQKPQEPLSVFSTINANKVPSAKLVSAFTPTTAKGVIQSPISKQQKRINPPASVQQNISITPVYAQRTPPSSTPSQKLQKTPVSSSPKAMSSNLRVVSATSLASGTTIRNPLLNQAQPMKKSFTKEPVASTTPKQSVVKTVISPKQNIQQVLSKTNQNFIPQAPTSMTASTSLNQKPPPQRKVTINPVRVIPANASTVNQVFSQVPKKVVGSQIVYAKPNVAATPRLAQSSQVVNSPIPVRYIQAPSVSKANSQPVVQTTPYRIAQQKRQAEVRQFL